MIDTATMPPLANQASYEANLQKVSANRRANAETLPGSLRAAFGPGAIQIGEWTVREVVLRDMDLFSLMDSPVHRQMLEVYEKKDKAEEVQPTRDEQYELVYQLTRSCKEVDQLFRKGGKEAVRQAAIETIPYSVKDPLVFSRLLAACLEQVHRQLETMQSFDEGEEDGKKKNSS